MFALEGYKLRVELHLNGEESAPGNPVSIYIFNEKGPFDDALDWPMKADVTFSAMKGDQQLNDYTFTTDQNSERMKRFQKPPLDNGGWGFKDFIAYNNINSYVVDNKLTLKITVKPRS